MVVAPFVDLLREALIDKYRESAIAEADGPAAISAAGD
jgi:hypothetical protein